MDLIVISSPDIITGESNIVNNLFLSGLKCFHIRKPGADIKAIIELMNGIAPQFYDRIALHQFHEIAADFGIKRLHYTEQARKESNEQQWQMQIDMGYKLSTSIHDITMLPRLKHFDYTFYGPVFNSISKPGYQSKLPEDFYIDRAHVNPKVIALGGVALSNLIRIKTMGFDGAAVLGTIWNEPAKATERFNELKDNLNIMQ